VHAKQNVAAFFHTTQTEATILLHKKQGPEMYQYLFQLREQEVRAARDMLDYVPGNLKLGLCTHVMGRWNNAVTAILYNCCMCWTWRHSVVITVVGFGPQDERPLQFLQWAAHAALEEGLLVLASGGEMGLRLRHHPDAFGPYRFGASPTEMQGRGADPPDVDVPDCYPPVLKFWHASWGKNTSHFAGTWVLRTLKRWDDDLQILINLDGDNTITPKYLSVVACSHANALRPRGHVTQAGRSQVPGTAGRISYRMKDFWHVNGYDVDGFYGMGYQDLDIRERIRRLRPEDPPGQFPNPGMQTTGGAQAIGWLDNWINVGGALPNDTDTKTADRGSAKITNVLPCLNSKGDLMTWADMNDANKKTAQRRMQESTVIRNTKVPFKSCWFMILPHIQIPADDAWDATENFSEAALHQFYDIPPQTDQGMDEPVAPGDACAASSRSVHYDLRLQEPLPTWENTAEAPKAKSRPRKAPTAGAASSASVVEGEVPRTRGDRPVQAPWPEEEGAVEALPTAPDSMVMSSQAASSTDALAPLATPFAYGAKPKRVYIQVMGLQTAYMEANTENTREA